MDWPARQVAASLEVTLASVNSALQRARATMAGYLPVDDRSARSGGVTARERALLDGMISAWESADATALEALLRVDARLVMPPTSSWFDGRDAIVAFVRTHAFGPDGAAGRFRAVATAANRHPALALYKRPRPGAEGLPFALIVLRVENAAVAEKALFRMPLLFGSWGLPATV
jgi:RNA polymerase sigma-70 factor (ECF subfamily)